MPPDFRGGRRVRKLILEIGQMLFSGSPEGRYILVMGLPCNDLRLPSVGFAFQEENASWCKATASPKGSENQE